MSRRAPVLPGSASFHVTNHIDAAAVLGYQSTTVLFDARPTRSPRRHDYGRRRSRLEPVVPPVVVYPVSIPDEAERALPAELAQGPLHANRPRQQNIGAERAPIQNRTPRHLRRPNGECPP